MESKNQLKSTVNQGFVIFLLLGIIFIPFTSNHNNFQWRISHALFKDPVRRLIDIFNIKALPEIGFYSDTVALQVLILLLIVIAFIVAALFNIIHKSILIDPYIRIIIRYYLAFVLFHYGFDKVFKAQFYQPEPNILFTPFGYLDKDIAYWSVIGLSRTYSISIGLIEILVAVLLFFNRTYTLGILFSFITFVQISLINIGFDISVKTYSFFLFLLNLYLLIPYYRSLTGIFVFNQSKRLPLPDSIKAHKVIQNGLSLSILLISIWSSVSNFVIAGNFNDDKAERPLLHGAYRVINKNNNQPVERFFIHRRNYLIFQDKKDEFTDFHFEIDTSNRKLLLYDYEENKSVIDYKLKNTTLTLIINRKDTIVGEKVNHQSLPALQNEWHWTIDEIGNEK